jgi:hypothetical protein
MSTLSVSNINGVTGFSGGIFDTLGNTANGANATAIASFGQANAAYGRANSVNSAVIAAFAVANTANAGLATAGALTGTIINYANTTAPSGYLKCDGNIYSRSAYSALASVIGTPPMLSSFTAEYANTNAQWTPDIIAVANGVAFTSNARTGQIGYSALSIPQYLGGVYTSTDGTTWTARTARAFSIAISGVLNGAVIANVSGGTWVLANNSVNGYASFPQTFTNMQSTTNLSTWTNRSIAIAAQTGVPTSNPSIHFNGLAGGGTSNRLVWLHTKAGQLACCIQSPWVANTATSDDGGATWSFTNSLPIANSSYQPSIASSNAGFVIVQGNTAYWSTSGQNWQDISANLRSALGFTSNNTNRPFYNVYQAGDKFIIPAYGNKFLVSPSSNGSNGNWSTTGYVSGLGNYIGSYNPLNLSRFTTSSYKIVHNGQCYAFLDSNYSTELLYSQDLQYWYLKDDFNYPVETSVGYINVLDVLNNKFLMYGYTYKTIFSFTANGAYNAATQFPVPMIINDSITKTQIGYESSAIPLIPYIKT